MADETTESSHVAQQITRDALHLLERRGVPLDRELASQIEAAVRLHLAVPEEPGAAAVAIPTFVAGLTAAVAALGHTDVQVTFQHAATIDRAIVKVTARHGAETHKYETDPSYGPWPPLGTALRDAVRHYRRLLTERRAHGDAAMATLRRLDDALARGGAVPSGPPPSSAILCPPEAHRFVADGRDVTTAAPDGPRVAFRDADDAAAFCEWANATVRETHGVAAAVEVGMRPACDAPGEHACATVVWSYSDGTVYRRASLPIGAAVADDVKGALLPALRQFTAPREDAPRP